jgi:hypothetical protein
MYGGVELNGGGVRRLKERKERVERPATTRSRVPDRVGTSSARRYGVRNRGLAD